MSNESMLVELPVLPATDTDDPRCSECAHCCTYIAVPIDRPSDRDTCSSILWYLYHGSTRVYQDPDHDWYVQFWTRCEALRPDGLCGVYDARPDLCEQFSPSDCEVSNDDYGELCGFDTAHEFLAWLKEHQPRLWHKALKGNARKRNLARAPKNQHATKSAPLELSRNGKVDTAPPKRSHKALARPK